MSKPLRNTIKLRNSIDDLLDWIYEMNNTLNHYLLNPAQKILLTKSNKMPN